MNYPNGRVNILDNAPNSVFNLYDKIPFGLEYFLRNSYYKKIQYFLH